MPVAAWLAVPAGIGWHAPILLDSATWKCRPKGDPQQNTAADVLTKDQVVAINELLMEDGSSAATRDRCAACGPPQDPRAYNAQCGIKIWWPAGP